MSSRKLLVTSALPYANGHIHIGHLVEYIQTDIWVRYQKLIGNTCHYICADDAHGTPIMTNAKKQGISPEKFVEPFQKAHLEDFKTYHIQFDHFGSTHTEENKTLSEDFFLKAKEKNAIFEKEIEQYFCPSCTLFLPDRFIKGICPKCNAKNQYGDTCESCSSTYSPLEIIEPICVTCNNTPILKKTTHYFFKLSTLAKDIEQWIASGVVRNEVKNKLSEWFTEGIQDWDISRDEPYFGFQIPGTTDKYFYVWVDAPIGYISSTKIWGEKNNINYTDIWKKTDYEIHHFIGKDILYFHTLFWPAILKTAGYRLPTKINIHGFLKVNGEKMSKSRGTFILAKEFSEKVTPEFLRYYYASKLTGSFDDIDLNFEDFVFKINSELLGKLINIASRLGSILTKKSDGILSKPDKNGDSLLKEIKEKKETILNNYETLHFHNVTKEVMTLADKTNKYIDEAAPWSLIKTKPEHAKEVCTTGLNAFRHLICYLSPILPNLAEKVPTFLNCPPIDISTLDTLLTDHKINPYSHLAQRLDPKTFKPSS